MRCTTTPPPAPPILQRQRAGWKTQRCSTTSAAPSAETDASTWRAAGSQTQISSRRANPHPWSGSLGRDLDDDGGLSGSPQHYQHEIDTGLSR